MGDDTAWTRLLSTRPETFAAQAGGERPRMALSHRIEWAERLGVLTPILRQRGETDFGLDLRRTSRTRALEAVDAGRMRTMLGKVQDYLDASGRAPLFLDPAQHGDAASWKYNAESLDGLGEYIIRAGSRQKGHEGEAIRAGGIQATVGMARQLRELGTSRAVIDPMLGASQQLKFRTVRREQGVAASTRDTKRALRISHFRRVAQGAATAPWDRTSHGKRGRWAAGLTAHNAILRGGEVGHLEGGRFDPGTDLTFRSITWCVPTPDSRGRYWLLLWVVPIKYRGMSDQAAFPIPIVRRSVGRWSVGLCGDPVCAYDALWLHWISSVGSEPQSARQDWQGRLSGGRMAADHPLARSPLFTGATGQPWHTGDSRMLARDIAKAAGEDPLEFGASSFRAGGATDFREVLGDGSKDMVKQRGRWASDVAEIYQRALLRTQLDASGEVGRAEGADMEAVCIGWSQPMY